MTAKPTIKLAPIDTLAPYARNSRTHSPEQIAALARSIREFGMVGAVVVRGGTLAKGHGTVEAIRLIFADGEPLYPAPGKAAGADPYPAGKVPVIDASGWTDEQFKGFVIADNQLADLAGWDDALLAAEVYALAEMEFDVTLLGFSDDEIAGLTKDTDVFAPRLEPTASHDEVKDADVMKAQGAADTRFSGADVARKVSLVCPHCAQEFQMNAADVALLISDE